MIDILQRAANAFTEPCNLGVVSDITVRRRLPRPDERLVPLIESVDLGIQFVEVFKCRGQPLGIPVSTRHVSTPRRRASALPKRE